ncbi:MAG: carboxypeptidase regulatory-like domain-containing protein [Gemmatimonadetes bacterium]|nr:carboxypeptidase regulatory-like domain-containing protein [Gemmatimonadota bacterium]
MRRLLALIVVALATPVAASFAQGRTVTLTGNVLDSVSGRPVESATVYLTDQSSAQTGQNGRFRLRGVPPERVILMFRRIGYSPRALQLNLEKQSGREIELGPVNLWAVPVGMDSLIIETRLVNRNPRLNDFFRRAKTGRGQYVTRQDIWRRNPVVTTELLRGIPGVTISCAYLTNCTPSTMRKVGLGQMTCPMRIMLDGIPTSISLDEIPPAWIAGVEIYRSAAFTPLELQGARRANEEGSSSCGTVVVWTGGDDY